MFYVTEDHSLVRPNGDIVKPHELHIGERLMHTIAPEDCDESIVISIDSLNFLVDQLVTKRWDRIPERLLNTSLEIKKQFLALFAV